MYVYSSQLKLELNPSRLPGHFFCTWLLWVGIKSFPTGYLKIFSGKKESESWPQLSNRVDYKVNELLFFVGYVAKPPCAKVRLNE